MILNTLVFVIFSFLVLLSTIGYGQVFSNNIFNGSRNIILPLKGLFGILTLYILSTITHTFFPHDYIHNLIILTLGIIFFFKYINNNRIDRNHLKYIVFFFIILYLGFLISKTNEDFPYYHLPNSLQFSEHKLQFGLGNLNHGFKHFSSLFLINSLFYFPIVEFYLFNISNFLFQIFFFSILLILLFENKINNFNKIFISLIFLIYLGKFYRLAEYGADYAGQFLVMLTCVYSFLLLNNKTINQVKREEIFYISSLLVVFSITIKFMFIIYVLVPFVVFLISFKLNEIIKFIFNLKFLFISLFLLLSVFFF